MIKDMIIGILLVAHGWAHIWYIILSQRLFEIKEEVAWTGESWLLSRFLTESTTRTVSTVGYSVSLIGFVVGGVLMPLGRSGYKPVIYVSAILSAITIFLFWDGKLSMLKDKGLIGLIVNFIVILYATRST